MPQIAWYGKPSPPNVGKTLVLELYRPGIMPIAVLDAMVGALKSIDNGALWKNSQAFAFPAAGPDAYSINCNASYHSGTVNLSAVAQIPMRNDRTGLFMTFTDQSKTHALQWMVQTSEIVVAVTALHVGTVLRQTFTGDASGNPAQFWQWHDGCWLNKGTPVNYDGWSFSLER
jgi:hypothetical protein